MAEPEDGNNQMVRNIIEALVRSGMRAMAMYPLDGSFMVQNFDDSSSRFNEIFKFKIVSEESES